jgi:hypothetical protein
VRRRQRFEGKGVELAGFEPAISCPPDRRDSQASLQLEEVSARVAQQFFGYFVGIRTRPLSGPPQEMLVCSARWAENVLQRCPESDAVARTKQAGVRAQLRRQPDTSKRRKGRRGGTRTHTSRFPRPERYPLRNPSRGGWGSRITIISSKGCGCRRTFEIRRFGPSQAPGCTPTCDFHRLGCVRRSEPSRPGGGSCSPSCHRRRTAGRPPRAWRRRAR